MSGRCCQCSGLGLAPLDLRALSSSSWLCASVHASAYSCTSTRTHVHLRAHKTWHNIEGSTAASRLRAWIIMMLNTIFPLSSRHKLAPHFQCTHHTHTQSPLVTNFVTHARTHIAHSLCPHAATPIIHAYSTHLPSYPHAQTCVPTYKNESLHGPTCPTHKHAFHQQERNHAWTISGSAGTCK